MNYCYLFKEYDIRGIYKKELTDEFAFELGVAVGKYMEKKHINSIIIGMDVRHHSSFLKKNLISGIISQGKNVIDIGLCSTPMFYFCVMKKKMRLGIMITASHNPMQYNGFKFVGEKARAIGFKEGMKEIMNIMMKKSRTRKMKKGRVKKISMEKDYRKFLVRKIPSKIKFLTIIDPNSMMGCIEAQILKRKCNIVVLNGKLGGKIRHGLNPLEKECLKQAQKEVKKRKARLGVVFDGDADRLVCIDEKGNAIDTDHIACLLIHNLVKKGDKVVYSINQSQIVKDIIKKKKAIGIVCKVGRTNNSKRLREVDGSFGCEKSGHYFFRDFNYLDSAALAAIHILKILQRTNKKMSELIAQYKRYHTTRETIIEVNSEEEKNRIMENIKKTYSRTKYRRLSKLDGLTFYYDNFWFNIRKSNTLNQIKYVIEAKTKEILKKEERKLRKNIIRWKKENT